MRLLWLARALWMAAGVGIVLGANGLRRSGSTRPQIAATPVVPALAMAMPTSDSLLDAAGVVRELDLFRPERAAPDQDASRTAAGAGVSPGPAMPTLRPQLILRGLVGGPALEAIVEGLPGVEGAVVIRSGETVAGITLRVVRRDTAILVARDTTWKLTVRRF